MLLNSVCAGSTAGRGLFLGHTSVNRSTRLCCKSRQPTASPLSAAKPSTLFVPRHIRRPTTSAFSEIAADNMPAEADLSFAAALPKEEIGALSFLQVSHAIAHVRFVESTSDSIVGTACRNSLRATVEE